jgi:hypothetical protein
MKNLFYYSFVTILVTLIFSSCSTYQYELGTMSTKDQAEKIDLLNQQEKKELRMRRKVQRSTDEENNLLSKADKNGLLRIKESRTKAIEDMAQQNQKRDIRVRSFDGYEAAYFYQAVNASNGATTAREGSQMNLLLINKTKQRLSYRLTDPYSMTAMVYLVEPQKAQPGFSLEQAKVIRQVAAVRLSAEGKKIIKLPIGFYKVDFVHNGEVLYSGPVTLNPQHKVSVSPQDVSGTGATVAEIDGCAYAYYK